MTEKLDSTSVDCVYQRLVLHLPRDGGPSGPALPSEESFALRELVWEITTQSAHLASRLLSSFSTQHSTLNWCYRSTGARAMRKPICSRRRPGSSQRRAAARQLPAG